MDDSVATTTETGQLTGPPTVSRHLVPTTGNRAAFVIAEDGAVQLQPLADSTLDELQGSAGSLPQPRSWVEMRKIVDEDRFSRGSEERRSRSSMPT